MRFFIKFFIFCSPFILLIVVTDLVQRKSLVPIKENSTYFIGSSRVKSYINPEILNKKNKDIYNIGVNGSTFLNNIILAEKLITKYQASELFIELSGIHTDYREDHIVLGISIFDYLKVVPATGLVETIETYLFWKFNLRLIFKKLILSESSNVGYQSSKNNDYKEDDSFLKWEDIANNCKYDISQYEELVAYLLKIADTHHTKISFFLPLTFEREEERCMVSAVFRALPNELRVNYTKAFLTDIRNPIYLRDKNHFNDKGAEVMTNYFDKFIKD
ncbi:MAG: hypothetical protein AB8G86_03800 [Saprospiraceae bacterium]